MEWRHLAAPHDLFIMVSPFFDKYEEIKIFHSGFLPHWDQNGKIQFVTFRLIDSLPQSKITELSELKQRFVESILCHGIKIRKQIIIN